MGPLAVGEIGNMDSVARAAATQYVAPLFNDECEVVVRVCVSSLVLAYALPDFSYRKNHSDAYPSAYVQLLPCRLLATSHRSLKKGRCIALWQPSHFL